MPREKCHPYTNVAVRRSLSSLGRMAKRAFRMPAPSFVGLKAASAVASHRASKGSRKRDTRAELKLRRYLRSRGLRFKTDVAALPGRPDIVFVESRVAVFIDGDFWHGRHLKERLARLAAGHNAGYWTQKILANAARDRRIRATLKRMGWRVVRAWETDVLRTVNRTGEMILSLVNVQIHLSGQSRSQADARNRAKAP